MLNSFSIYNKNSLILIIILAIVLGALPVFSLGSAIMLTVIGLVGIVFYIFLPKDDRQFLVRLYNVCFSVRFILLIFIYFISISGFLGYRGEISPDSRYNTIHALELSKEWRGDKIITSTSDMHGVIGYNYILAIFYTIINYGADQLSPNPMLADKLINICISLVSIIIIFYLTKEVFGKKIATLASILIAFWPPFILWAITNLRDPINMLLVSFILFMLVKFNKKNKWQFILLAASSIIYLFFIRPYLVPFILIITIISFFIYLRISKLSKIIIVGIIVFLCLAQRTLGPKNIIGRYLDSNLSFQSTILLNNSNIIAQGGSTYEIYDNDIILNGKVNKIKFIKGFLKGWIYFMLVPFPWTLSPAPQFLLITLCMLSWYFLIPFSVIGILWSLRYRFRLSAPIISYLFIVTSAYALIEGNVGSALRHRDLVIPFYFIFSIVGLAKIFAPEKLLVNNQPDKK